MGSGTYSSADEMIWSNSGYLLKNDNCGSC